MSKDTRTVVLLCNYAAKYSGNFISSIQDLITAGRYRFIVVLPKEAKNYQWSRIRSAEVRFIDFSPKGLIHCFYGIRRSTPGDILLHMHFCNALSALIARMFFSHIIYHYHMTLPSYNGFKGRLKLVIQHVIYTGITFAGVSSAVYRDLKTFFPDNNVYLVANAIDFKLLDKRSSNEYQTSLSDLTTGKVSIAIFGTHFLRKGVDIASRSLPLVHSALPVVLLVFAHDVEKTIHTLKEESFFSDSIVVLPVTEYVKSIFDTVDFFVSPSRDEAFGYAVVEASSSSCEVIASLIPGQDTLKDIPETIWISPNDSVGLANAITDRIPLLHSSDFSSRKDYILSHYSIAAWVNSVNAMYSEVFSL